MARVLCEEITDELTAAMKQAGLIRCEGCDTFGEKSHTALCILEHLMTTCVIPGRTKAFLVDTYDD